MAVEHEDATPPAAALVLALAAMQDSPEMPVGYLYILRTVIHKVLFSLIVRFQVQVR